MNLRAPEVRENGSSWCTQGHEKPETAILTVVVRVFDVCARKLICHYYHTCEDIVLG